MEEVGGYIKLFRKFTKWEWYDDINTKTLFIHLLLTVNWKDGKWHGQTIPRGSIITSLSKLASETRLSEQNIKTALKHLISTNEITQKVTKAYRVITIVKYADYQILDCTTNKEDNQEINKALTKSQQRANQQVTTIEEVLRSKEEKELKNKTYIGVLSSYTSDTELLNALSQFVEMRKKMKGYTVHALELNLKTLDKIAVNDEIKIEIVNQSIEKSWKSFFALQTVHREKEERLF